MNISANTILKQYFGYDEFRHGQFALVETLAGGRDALGIMPTGAGKSLCYQVPALLLPGITLVVSPLISLMRDQVQALVQNGVAAAFINSSLTDAQLQRVMQNAHTGQYKLIYIAPERLLAPSMLELAHALPISLLAVDEAHCISQWGQDFRPAYLDIPAFVQQLPARPVLAAFTATATPRVRDDILATLGLQNPLSVVTGFDRPNLYFEVKQPKDKYAALVDYLRENSGCGIVYCSTRKHVEKVAAQLVEDGYSAAGYHAGMPGDQRSHVQDDFLHDRVQIIVATNAFGMGIDKSNVRFVLHYNMPQNVESYYQEAGRAGRDSLPADCLLLFGRQDITTALFLINQSENPDEIPRKKQRLNEMERYCEGNGCLRGFMLRYFGEQDTPENCGNCGNCTGNFDEIDATVDAQKLLSHITRLNNLGKHYGFVRAMDILQAKTPELRDLPTFGLMKGLPRTYLRRLVSRLTALDYLHADDLLRVTPKAREVLVGGATVMLRGQRSSAQPGQFAFSQQLYAALKQLRLAVAQEEKVPAYVVFSDATLVDMCKKLPRTPEQFLQVSGVGQVKLERYGARFLPLLVQHQGSAEEQPAPPLTEETLLQQMAFDDSPQPITRVADSLNAVLLLHGMPTITGAKLNALLVQAGYLQNTDDGKRPTPQGEALGISTVQRSNARGNFVQCLFNAAAQRVCAALAIAHHHT
ncbi:MAG: DNA helicase RecQ [Oscillospiraceae bacterium]|nr:DNA helicase RecQ [Oscillospiraceae bacterium]